MSCIHKFFEENYDHILQIAQIKVGEDAGDLINDLCLSYLEDYERITPICERGELMSYICRTLAICGFSKTSRFYYKYRKANELISRNFPQALLRNEEQIVDNVRDIDKELEVAREKLSAAEDAADTELAMRFLLGTSPSGILGAFI